MRKNQSQNSMRFINMFVVALVLVLAMLFSSCSAAKDPGESQTPVIDPTKYITADNQGKNENDTTDLYDGDEPTSDDVDVSDYIEEDSQEDQASNKDVTDSTSSDAGNEIKELDLVTDMQLGALKVDMTKAEVEKVMKSDLVDSTTKEEYGMKTEIQTYKDGTIINLLDGKIYSISVKSSDYATPRGLKIGDTEETLRKLYGEPSAVEDGKWIYSSRGYDVFFVTVKDGKVVEIMISQVL